MKSVILVAAAALALAGTAAAGNGNGNKAGNGAQTGHISITYPSPIGGTWTCSGERVAKAGPSAFTKDSEDCTISDPASYFTPGIWVGMPWTNGFAFVLFDDRQWFWASDFDGRMATAITYVVSLNGDGTGHVHVVASY